MVFSWDYYGILMAIFYSSDMYIVSRLMHKMFLPSVDFFDLP